MNKFLYLTLLVCLLCSCSGDKKNNFNGSDITKAKINGNFSLTDQYGKNIKLTDFKGNVVAIFFYLNGDATDILPSINGKKLILEPGPRPSRDVRGNLQTYDFGNGKGAQVQGIADINVLQVTYTVLEKIDPNFKG